MVNTFRIRRGGSRGFVLKEDSVDEDLYMESLNQETSWLDNFRNKYPGKRPVHLLSD